MFNIGRLWRALLTQLPGGVPLPKGVFLRSVQLQETLMIHCVGCGFQLHRPSHRAGFLVEMDRPAGRFTLADQVTTTNCHHCHQETPTPYLFPTRAVAQAMARSILLQADYAAGALIRIRPRQ